MTESALIDTLRFTGKDSTHDYKPDSTDVQPTDASSIYEEDQHRFHRRIDKLFICLFLVQWPVAILLALYLTPSSWAGNQNSTHWNARDVITRIAEIIQQIDSYQTTVAAAVEEQTATTREIANAVQDSATGSASISDHIADIVGRAESTKRSVEQVGHSVESLHDIASRVKSLVEVYQSDKRR